MAEKGGWVKMRGTLLSSPKLIRMVRILHQSREFREWLTPGGSSSGNGQVVSDHALRCVVHSLLCSVWCAAREHGHLVTACCADVAQQGATGGAHETTEPTVGDLLLGGMCVDDLDGMCGCPTIGRAMVAVGWALECSDGSGVILPEFSTYNAGRDAAERMRAIRDRKKRCADVAQQGATSAQPLGHRVEKSRDIRGSTPLNPPGTDQPKEKPAKSARPTHPPVTIEQVTFPSGLDTPGVRQSLADWLAHHRTIGHQYRSLSAVNALLSRYARAGPQAFVDAVVFSIGNNYQGLIDPKGKHGKSNGLGGLEKYNAPDAGRW